MKTLWYDMRSDGVKWPPHLVCEYWIILLMTCSQQAWNIVDNAMGRRPTFTFLCIILWIEGSLPGPWMRRYCTQIPSYRSSNSPHCMHSTNSTPGSRDNPYLGMRQWIGITPMSIFLIFCQETMCALNFSNTFHPAPLDSERGQGYWEAVEEQLMRYFWRLLLFISPRVRTSPSQAGGCPTPVMGRDPGAKLPPTRSRGQASQSQYGDSIETNSLLACPSSATL